MDVNFNVNILPPVRRANTLSIRFLVPAKKFSISLEIRATKISAHQAVQLVPLSWGNVKLD